MSINLHFTDQDWARVERDWTAWWDGELERPIVMIGGTEQDVAIEEFTSNFALSVPGEAVIDHYQKHLEASRFYGDAFPKWWPNFGPGILAGFVGATVHTVPDTVWFSPAQDVPISAVRPVCGPANPWWQRVRELTRLAASRWGDKVAVGHTDLGGNLDIVASLRGTQRLLFELSDAPDEVARLAGEITRLWLRYYDELDAIIRPACRGTTPWAAIWSPGRCYMLQSDFSFMISPQMFERFVMPDLAACCDALDHAFYHLDGKGQIPHLDLLLSLHRLRGIQWIPGDGAPPPEQWLPLLKRIRDSGKLCQLYVTAEGARTIVRQLGGRGFALAITDKMTTEEAGDFLHALATDDIGG